MLRRFVLTASISVGLAGFVLAGPAAALSGGGSAGDVYTGQGSAAWGGWNLSTPTTPLALVDKNGATAALRGLLLSSNGTKSITGGNALLVLPNSSLPASAVITGGSVGKGKVTADGTVDGLRLKIILAMAGLSATSVNGPSTTIGTGTITVTVW